MPPGEAAWPLSVAGLHCGGWGGKRAGGAFWGVGSEGGREAKPSSSTAPSLRCLRPPLPWQGPPPYTHTPSMRPPLSRLLNFCCLAGLSAAVLGGAAGGGGSCRDKKSCKVVFSQEDLKKRLTPLQYHVTQEKGTESAFDGEYTYHKAHGIYKCVVCGSPLFKSETKFDSNSGWPSFYDVIASDRITFTDDYSYGMHRVETSCSQCGAHLGHIFDDGPRPTGKRYCINSASLAFEPAGKNHGGEASSSSTATQPDKTEL